MNRMVDSILSQYAYWFVFVLSVVGLYGMLVKKNLVKKLIGMTIFQTSIIMFFVAAANKWHATIPVLLPPYEAPNPDTYINPLPHTLMLTAIVVGVATLGVAFALLVVIYKNYNTVDEPELLERMK
jgi:multicomponent Na+:H+ antiporter subunit C